ncbi:S-layer homology domain-containing protein [Paenibacillus baekrokdamisoli]|nr:S-layer homology domain-containing protein [Paenibacillus baekrokdamisoli]
MRLVILVLMVSCLFGLSAAPVAALTTPVIDKLPPIKIDRIPTTTNKGNASLIWYLPTPGQFIISSGPPAVGSDSTIYLGNNYFAFVGVVGSLTAVSRGGGKKWDYPLKDSLLFPPTIGPDGTVYIGEGSFSHLNGSFIALNPDGTKKWAAYIGAVDSRPVFGADGTVYANVRDGTLHALQPNDGTEKWVSKVGVTTTAYMAVGKDGTIYMGNVSDTLFAVKPNGSIKWTYKAGGLVNTTPVVGSDGMIYVGADDSKLYAINPNGTKQWEYALGGTPFSPIIGTDGMIYVGAANQTVYALLPNNSLKWKTAFNKAITPIVFSSTGMLHLLTADGMVQALNSSDGSIQWSYGISTPDGIIAPVIGDDGTVYVTGSKESKQTLYALRVKISSISLNKSQIALPLGKSESLSVTLSPSNAPNRKVTWSSNNNGVAAVDNTGNVTAVSSGKATVTARSDDGGLIATCEVTVTNPPGTIEVDSVTVSPAELSLPAGESVKLKAAVQPVDAFNRKLAWSSSNPGVAQVDESGKVTGMTPGTAVITVTTSDGGFTAASKVTILPGTKTPGSELFTDIGGHWAGEEIAEAYKLHITNGYPDFTFRPDASITRAEFVVMLMNGLKPELQALELPFKDKGKIGAWAQHSISGAMQLGIVSGYPDGNFRPGANITHSEMAAMVFKASGIPLAAVSKTGYTDDTDIPGWARGAVSTIEKKGIIIVGGKTAGAFAPQALSTRAEAVAWIVRMLEIKARG